MKIILSATLLFLLSISTNANVQNNHASLPLHTAEHMYPGCPFNSTCTPEMGQKFISYHHALKRSTLKSFFRTNGIPVTGKRKKVNQMGVNNNEASWDSPCYYKQNKKATFERVMTFAKNFNHHNIQYPFYLLLDAKGVISKFSASNDDSVLGVYNKKLVFNRLIEDVYYQYQVDNQGQISIEKEISFPSMGKNIRCTKQLLSSVKERFSEENLNQLNCRLIYGPKKELAYLFYLPRCE